MAIEHFDEVISPQLKTNSETKIVPLHHAFDQRGKYSLSGLRRNCAFLALRGMISELIVIVSPFHFNQLQSWLRRYSICGWHYLISFGKTTTFVLFIYYKPLPGKTFYQGNASQIASTSSSRRMVSSEEAPIEKLSKDMKVHQTMIKYLRKKVCFNYASSQTRLLLWI